MPIVRVTELTLLAEGHELVELGALLSRRAERLDDEEVAGHAAAADRVGGVLHRDVVVDDDCPDRDASASAISAPMSKAMRSPV